MQRRDTQKRPAGGDGAERCVQVRSGTLLTRRARAAAAGGERCERPAAAARCRQGAGGHRSAGAQRSAAEAGAVAQLHLCFC